MTMINECYQILFDVVIPPVNYYLNQHPKKGHEYGTQFDNGCIYMKCASHYQQCQGGYADHHDNRCRLTLIENQFIIVNINKLYSNKTYLWSIYCSFNKAYLHY